MANQNNQQASNVSESAEGQGSLKELDSLEGLELYQLYEKMEPLADAEPISKMPVGPGWWVVLALLLLAVIATVGWKFYKRYQNRHRYYAIVEIKALPDNYGALDLSAILKRCALSQFPRQEVAALTGTYWCEFLNRHYLEGAGFTDFNQLQYQAEGFDRTQLKQQAIGWLTHYKAAP